MGEVNTPFEPKVWWEKHVAAYPFTISITNFISPVDVNRTVGQWHQFICVPFDGQQHWGFAEEAGLRSFCETYGVPYAKSS